jgi:hypothetical protein
LNISDDDLKEIFSLFSSCTKFERDEIYDKESPQYFKNIRLFDKYELSEDKKEISLDAIRSVLYFLFRNNYALSNDGAPIDLSFIEDYFI